MNFEELLAYLDLEEPSQFEYFENLADLVEADEEIAPEAVYTLLAGVDMEVFGELITHYFEEMQEAIPDDATELYVLLETVRMAFTGMAAQLEEERDMVVLADEFDRFRNWFSFGSKVLVRETDQEGAHERTVSVRDALALSRLEKMGCGKFSYSFDEATGFEMNRYTMSFAAES